MKLMYRSWVLQAAFLFILSGCHAYLFCSWNLGYSDRVFSNSQITGTYALTSYSKKMMEYEGKYEHIPNSTIQINADSTYTIANAPDWLADSLAESHRRYFTKTGKWQLNCYGSSCSIQLSDKINGAIRVNKKGRTALLFNIGDPDSCQGMVYEKQ